MIDLLLFTEDDAQEQFVGRLLRRIAKEEQVSLRVRVRSASGGFGRALTELGRFCSALRRGYEVAPGIVVVAVDANCHGLTARRREVDEVAADLGVALVHAIPDPHIERWLLLDGHAFRRIVGHGCDAPDQKCEKDRYKILLAEAVRRAGVKPLLGGIEYAEDIAEQMNLDRAGAADRGFALFVDELRTALRTSKRFTE